MSDIKPCILCTNVRLSASSDNLKSLIEQESIAVESFERMAIEHVQQYIGLYRYH